MRRKKNSDVQARYQMKPCRYRAVFFDAPDLPIVFNGYTEDGKERHLRHFVSDDGTVIYLPKAAKDFDSINTIKEVDG